MRVSSSSGSGWLDVSASASCAAQSRRINPYYAAEVVGRSYVLPLCFLIIRCLTAGPAKVDCV